ncbi:Adenine phosphoribosyltransferase [Candidatus Hepatincolaceae symbiont of Richtersius coronifer]
MKINLDDYIGKIPDFPKKGILFYDISPLLADAKAWQETINRICDVVKKMQPDVLVGLETRGFLLSAPVAYNLSLGSVMIRKKGKLPGKILSQTYDLEYNSDTLEIQENAIKPGQKVVILDDLLATGGTINSACQLLNKLKAEILGAVCIIELAELKGQNATAVKVESLLTY